MTDVAVIGSGPAGTFCTKALIARGLKVTIFDVGETLDAGRRALAYHVGRIPKDNWTRGQIEALIENNWVKSYLPRKTMYGSDFAYGDNRPYFPIEGGSRDFVPSFARGGYSMFWGATALPADNCDIVDWPISRSDLEPHYRKVLGTMPLAGAGPGNLKESFPTYRETLGEIAYSAQTDQLMDDLQRAESRLRRLGVLFGPSRLAIRSQPDENQMACDPCGLCLNGCPRESIYSTEWDLSAMIASGSVQYCRGTIVEHVRENPSGAELDLVNLHDGSRETKRFAAIFIAAGVLGTAKILLNSRQVFDQPIVVKDSQKFLIPILRGKSISGPIQVRHLALANTFIEMKVPKLSDHWVHMQVSPINYAILQVLGIDPVMPGRGRGRILAPLLNRMMVAWCGVHSDHGGQLKVSLTPESKGKVLKIVSEEAPRVRENLKIVARATLHAGLAFRSLFLTPLMRIADTGTGYHCGGSFPMSESPKSQFDSDLLGRPFGWQRVFAVDGSILPSIPATTIAFNIMANAHRIGTDAPIER